MSGAPKGSSRTRTMPGLSAARRYCLGDQAGSAGPIHSGLLNVLALIADYGVSFRSLSDPWADTTTPHGRLMPTVLGGLAEFEAPSDPQPNQRRAGPSEGSRCSVRKLTKHQQTEALARIAQGETLTAIARSYNVSHMTISRLASCGMAGQRQTRTFAVDVGVF